MTSKAMAEILKKAYATMAPPPRNAVSPVHDCASAIEAALAGMCSDDAWVKQRALMYIEQWLRNSDQAPE